MGWFKSASSWVSDKVDSVKEVASSVSDKIQSVASSVTDNLSSNIQSSVSKAIEKASEDMRSKISQSVKDSLGSISNIGDVTKEVTKAVGSTVASATTKSGDVLKSAVSNVSDFAQSETGQKIGAIVINAGVKSLPVLVDVFAKAGAGALAGAAVGGAGGSVVPILGNIIGAIGGAGVGALGGAGESLIEKGLPVLSDIFKDSVEIAKADFSESSDSQKSVATPKMSQEEYDRKYQEEYQRQYNEACQKAYEEEYQRQLKAVQDEIKARELAQSVATQTAMAVTQKNDNLTRLALIGGLIYLMGVKK